MYGASSRLLCSLLLICIFSPSVRLQVDTTAVDESTVTTFTATDGGSGSGSLDTTTASDSTTGSGGGSGSDAATTQESSGVTTVTDISGSGFTEITTSNSETTGTTSSIFDGSGSGSDVLDDATTTDSTQTTIFEIITEPDATTFVATTGAVTEAAADFPWYYIVIICLAIIIIILIVLFIVFYCKNKDSGPTKQSTNDADDKGVAAVVSSSPVSSPPEPPQLAREPAPTVLPPATTDEPDIDFVSSSPMAAPLHTQDVYATVKKRSTARTKPRRRKGSDFKDADGFNEPLIPEHDDEPSRKPTPRYTPNTTAHQIPAKSVTDPYGRTITYQPYLLPTPIQTALTGRALGDQLTDEAIAERNQLQRSDIERHRNKQRLRMQRAKQQSVPYKDEQRSIDEVLQPLPPRALQGIEERRRLKKYGLLNSADERIDQSLPRKTPKKRSERPTSDTSDDTTTSDQKKPAHEAVISKMTKLLEDAYALLAPAVHKTIVKPIPSAGGQGTLQNAPPYTLQDPYLQQQAMSKSPNDQRLFTRTNTPPALLSDPGFPGQVNPAYTPGPQFPRANDSRSPVWTPYRTYDRLQEIRQQDPSLLLSPKPQHPYASSQDTLIPTTPHRTYTNPTNTLPQSVQDPFSVMDPQSSIPGRAHPVRPHQSDALQMHPITSTPGNPNIEDANQRNFVDAGVDEPAASIVQSIKDTLAEMAGKRKSGETIDESNC